MSGHVVGAVLAGGQSTRMGVPKASLQLGGRTFLERAVDTLLSVFDTVYVCGGDVTVLGATLVHDPHPGQGPLGGIVSALTRADGADAFIVAVDMPLIGPTTVHRICRDPLGEGHARIARVDGRPQPLFGLYSGDLLRLARRHLSSTDRSVIGFSGSVPHLELVDIEDGSLRNINTDADLRELTAEWND